MKRPIALIFSGILLTTSAWGSKARLKALGQDPDWGSWYLKDSRNVHHNPAHLVDQTNYAVFEGAKTEGGYFSELLGFAYGLYFNSHKGFSDIDERINLRSGYTLPDVNRGDFFFAGDSGIKWGIRLAHGNGENNNTNSAEYVPKSRKYFGLGVGVVAGNLDVSVNIGFKNEIKFPKSDLESKNTPPFPIVVGVNYDFNGANIHLRYDQDNHRGYLNKDALEKNIDYDKGGIEAGIAYVTETSKSSRHFVDFSLRLRSDHKNKGIFSEVAKDANADGSFSEISTRKTFEDSLMIGFEGEANSWLTLRGSIRHNMFLGNYKIGGSKAVTLSHPQVNAGLSLTYGQLVLDGVLSGVAGGTLGINSIASNVSLTYSF